MDAVITAIQGYSIHDGPGIRTVVFFKGCGLDCVWCANPECISPHIEMGFLESLCTGCGKCFAACPVGALCAEGEHRINYDKCIACGKCAEACYYGAMVQYGKSMTVSEVFDAVKRDKMFYEDGGGVTVSGGEPLLYADFVRELFMLCRNDGISTCIETSGFAPSDNLRKILDVTDYVLFDIKLLDGASHREFTCHSNELILQNAKIAAECGADILFRIPLMPTVNDSDENIQQTSEFVKSITDSPRIQLMPYHRLGDGKYKALGRTNDFYAKEAFTAQDVEAVRQRFADFGVECSISK